MPSMSLTVIGSCSGSPQKNEACSGYLITAGATNMLLDCGSGVLTLLQNIVPRTDVSHIIISHYHFDHFADAVPALYGRLIDIQTHLTDERLHFYSQEGSPLFPLLQWKPYASATPISEESSFTIGPMRLNFLRTIHPVPCLAVKVSVGDTTLVYTADSAYFDGLANFAAGANLLLAECSLYRSGNAGRQAGHMTSDDAAKLAVNAAAKRFMITHLPIYGKHQQLVDEIRDTYEGELLIARPLLNVCVD